MTSNTCLMSAVENVLEKPSGVGVISPHLTSDRRNSGMNVVFERVLMLGRDHGSHDYACTFSLPLYTYLDDA